MYIDLVQTLRCLNPHEDSWLVAVTRRMEGRSIIQGTLGCPVCRREYPVVDGVGYFGADPEGERIVVPQTGTDESDVLRLAALLGLEAPGGIVVLEGRWARLAAELRALVPVSCVLLDPQGDAELVGEALAALRTRGAIPLAAGSVRAVALDPAEGGGERLGEAQRVLGSRGRLVAPARLSVPPDADELARDDELWVARTRLAASAPVGIARGARPSR